MWKMIYDPQNGALNRFLGVFGIEGKSWLGDYSLALPAVGVVGTYVYFGLAMVLLTAGVQKIPTSLYDAARVDGAGPFREFLAVTLPGLRGEIAVALTLTTIYALRNFDLVYITTRGGPGPLDDGAGLPGVLARVRERAGGLGRGRRDRPDVDHLRDHAWASIAWARGGRDLARGADAGLHDPRGVLAVRARADRRDRVDGAAGPGRRGGRSGPSTGSTSSNFKTAWEEGNFGAYLKSSVIVAVVRGVLRDDLLDPVRLRVRADALPRVDRAVLRVPARA